MIKSWKRTHRSPNNTKGDTFWFADDDGDDRFHREDGPACMYADGREEWWVNGHRVEPFTPEELPLILLNLVDL